jgi:PP-loop superfamily ATP-utilizing enzyme
VRHHGEQARVEIGRDELSRALDADMSRLIARELMALGYQEVTIDPRGYRLGSLNEGIHVRLVVGG